jgi:hypothetical protein
MYLIFNIIIYIRLAPVKNMLSWTYYFIFVYDYLYARLLKFYKQFHLEKGK